LIFEPHVTGILWLTRNPRFEKKDRSIMGKNISYESIVVSSTTRLGAIKKFVKNGKTEIPLAGDVLKPADVSAVFQASLDTQVAVNAGRAAYKEALAAREVAEQRRSVIDEALKGWVLNRFGADSAEAHEFGYSARKVAVVSAETRANAVKLNLATREARGTRGPKAKLGIKGTLSPAVPAVPPSPPPVAAPAAAPVPTIAAMAPVAAVTVHVPTVTPPPSAPAAGGNATSQ
jgi:hypothetical protein